MPWPPPSRPARSELLAANPAVAEVIPDAPIREVTASAVKPGRAALASSRSRGPARPRARCSLTRRRWRRSTPPARAIGAGLGYTGAGVKVAYIADGINLNDPDFIRANGKHVFIDYQDFSGTGTRATSTGGEAFLDASSIAAQGREVYNVASYGTGLAVPCDIRILGVAPGVSMVGPERIRPLRGAFNSVVPGGR